MSGRTKIGAWGAALLALTSTLWSGANASPVEAGAAPQAWIVYAQSVSQQFQAALAGESEAARRFHTYFARQAPPPADPESNPDAEGVPQEAPTLRVKVWLNRSGHVTRVDVDEVKDEAALADLRAVLLAQKMGPPPRRMKQPLIVRLALGTEL